VPAIEAYGFGLLPYFPLASGMLSGKYQRDVVPKESRLGNTPRLANKYMTERNWAIVEALRPHAAAHGKTVLDLAIGWLAAKPYVSSVIAGATAPEQVEQNVAACAEELSPELLAGIDEILNL
jgi:aryl-alcohol dehydrogenase-like predicted oxidoreductase